MKRPRRATPAPQFAAATGWTAHLAGDIDTTGQACRRCGVVLTEPVDNGQAWPVGSWVAVEDLDRSPADWPHRSLASRRYMIGLGILIGNDADNALALLDWELRGGSVCVAVVADP